MSREQKRNSKSHSQIDTYLMNLQLNKQLYFVESKHGKNLEATFEEVLEEDGNFENIIMN